MSETNYAYSLSRQVESLNAFFEFMVDNSLKNLTLSTNHKVHANEFDGFHRENLPGLDELDNQYPDTIHEILSSFEQEALDYDENLNSNRFSGIYNYEDSQGKVTEVFFIMSYVRRTVASHGLYFSFDVGDFRDDSFATRPRKSVKEEELFS